MNFQNDPNAGETAMPEMEDSKTDESKASQITRRRFILGVIAGGAMVGTASYKILSPSGHGRSFGGERLISLNVNGKMRRVEVMKQETLAWTLRYKLGLTGTKLGCDRAECGSCTVLIDEVPYYSCSVLTNTVRGKSVTTIEGLAAADGTLHPVQQAVVDEQGFQCAFCMPGFVMAAVSFLKKNPNPTRVEMAQGLSGNLCRCQDYSKILDAMMRGAEYMRDGMPAKQQRRA
jgi:aerobic-type carbon monoxide dehydrogenase small subunit (CoxS/CutS family)